MQLNNLPFYALALTLLASPSFSDANNILTVTVDGTPHAFDFKSLTEMPQTTVVTKNDYVDSITEFSGPKLKDILERYDIGPEQSLIMTAINDYSVTIPASDAYDYNVILALFNDGSTMSVRDKGPIWVIYPMDDHEELQNDSYNNRIIWQLRSIMVE